MKSKSIRSIFALTAAVGSALIASAQPSPGDGQQGQPQGEFRRGSGLPAGGQGQGFGMQIGRVLTDEQRDSWREIIQGQREQMESLQKKMRDARKAVLEASLADKLDETAIRRSVEDVAKVEADMAILNAKAVAKLNPPLTAEQKEQIKNAPAPQFGGGQGNRPPRGDGASGGNPRRGNRPPPQQGDGASGNPPQGGEQDNLPPKQ